MQTFGVDSNNDLFLAKATGNISFSRDLQAVLECCAHVAKARLSEMVLATDRGLPFFETVFNGVPNLAQFEASLRAAILGVANVLEITALTIALKGNALTYQATIATTYGIGTIS